VYTLKASTRHFIRHYAEMVAAMFIGMGVLFVPAVAGLAAAGMTRSELETDAPALLLLIMAVSMTVPMVAWMRYRGHGWPASAEMSAAMLVPTFGLIVLLWAGLVEDIGTLFAIEHVVMLPAMLLVMLLRRDEYTRSVHHTGVVTTQALPL
jgi:hypothetical protein